MLRMNGVANTCPARRTCRRRSPPRAPGDGGARRVRAPSDRAPARTPSPAPAAPRTRSAGGRRRCCRPGPVANGPAMAPAVPPRPMSGYSRRALFVAPDVGHEAPEHRDHEQVEHAHPHEEQRAQRLRAEQAFEGEQGHEREQAGDEERVHRRHHDPPRPARHQPGEHRSAPAWRRRSRRRTTAAGSNRPPPTAARAPVASRSTRSARRRSTRTTTRPRAFPVANARRTGIRSGRTASVRSA